MRGYWHIYKPDHPFHYPDGYVRHHRLVYEECYNCCLLRYTDIHHRDGDRANNVWYNLIPYNRAQHMRLERIAKGNNWLGRKHKLESKAKMSQAKLGKPSPKRGKTYKKSPIPSTLD